MDGRRALRSVALRYDQPCHVTGGRGETWYVGKERPSFLLERTSTLSSSEVWIEALRSSGCDGREVWSVLFW